MGTTIHFRLASRLSVSKFFEFPAKIEAYQRWANGLKFTLNEFVCVGRPKSDCHFEAGGAILLLT